MEVISVNTLSLLIYGISTLGNLANFLVAIGIMGGVGFVVLGIVCLYNLDSNTNTKKEVDDFRAEVYPSIKKWMKRCVYGFLASLVISVFVPEQKYLIMIAASEVGGMAINQQLVKDAGNQLSGLSGDAVELLKTYIQGETKTLKDAVKGSDNPKN
jgi:hypothetical protein